MSDNFVGLARIIRKASSHPSSFRKERLPSQIGAVSDPEIGTYVLILPQIEDDQGWAAVLVNETTAESATRARFTWVHPGCLQPLSTHGDGLVTIGHTLERGWWKASHDIGDGPPGICRCQGKLVLDARWYGSQGTGGHKGYCYPVVRVTCLDERRMGDILDFACLREAGVVACDRGTHRSVSAGKILELFWHRGVDYKFASANNCPCGLPAGSYMRELSSALRSLGQPETIPLLCTVLQHAGCWM